MIFKSINRLESKAEKSFCKEQIQVYIRLVEVYCEKNNLQFLSEKSDKYIDELMDIGIIENPDEINDLIEQLDPNQKTLIFTDLFGGSVNLEITRKMMSDKAMIIAGFNLAIILECLYLSDEDCNEQNLLNLIDQAKNQMVLVNSYFKSRG